MSAIVLAHLALIGIFPDRSESINKNAAFFSQLFGGLLVVYSLNSAIGNVSRGSLLSMLLQYLRDFPLLKRNITAQMHGNASVLFGGSLRMKVTRNPKSVQDHLKYLQEQIDYLAQETREELEGLEIKLGKLEKDSNTKHSETNQELTRLRESIEESAAGGVAVQLFGVLLVVYGGFASYVT